MRHPRATSDRNSRRRGAGSAGARGSGVGGRALRGWSTGDGLGAQPVPCLSYRIPLSLHSPARKTSLGPPRWCLRAGCPPAPSWKAACPGCDTWKVVLARPGHRAAGGCEPITLVPGPTFQCATSLSLLLCLLFHQRCRALAWPQGLGHSAIVTATPK